MGRRMDRMTVVVMITKMKASNSVVCTWWLLVGEISKDTNVFFVSVYIVPHSSVHIVSFIHIFGYHPIHNFQSTTYSLYILCVYARNETQKITNLTSKRV